MMLNAITKTLSESAFLTDTHFHAHDQKALVQVFTAARQRQCCRVTVTL